ncbi:MAG TPA: tetratricopeptide repeat protein [Pyrinomonadaceae bacterium]
MDAIISGRAGVAFLFEGEVFASFDVEDPATLLPRRRADIRLLFGEAPDLEFFEDVDHAAAARHLERAFNCASALDLALILFDPDLTDDLRDDAAEELERLLAEQPVAEYLENVLYARPLPAASDLVGARARCTGGRLPKLSATLQILEGYQPSISAVRIAWDNLPTELFGGEQQKADFQHAAVREGLFRLLSNEVANGPRARLGEFIIRSLTNPSINTLWNHRDVIQQWPAPFRTHAAAPPFIHEDEDFPGVASPKQKGKRRQRRRGTAEEELNKLQGQLDLIVTAMRQRNLPLARKLTDEVINYQLKYAKPIHAAKTLCNLATEAKVLGMYSLQLELTDRAIQIAPDDGWSWAQYADALLKLQRPVEALRAYEQAESFGAGAVAKSGRAETLRALNRLPEALAAYDAVVSEHPGDVVAKRGRAEALKASGRLDDALAAYDSVLDEDVNDVIAKSGRAETLRAMGRLPEALAAYDAAVSEHPESVVAKNGRAETLRAMGRVTEALAAYDSIVVEHPEDVVAKTGRAETLRALGRLPEALAAYDSIVAEHPEDVVAKTGRAEALKASGRLDDALAAYDSVLAGNPEDAIARNGRSYLLAALRRYDEALELLPEDPATSGDWIGYHIRGMILLRTRRVDEAILIFERGVKENPFPSSREYFRSALALACLRRGDYARAGSALAEVDSPLLQPQANVLRLHTYGASGEEGRAAEAYEALSDKPWSISDELVAELHRKYILKVEPRHDDDWVFEQEMDTFLFDPNQQILSYTSLPA